MGTHVDHETGEIKEFDPAGFTDAGEGYPQPAAAVIDDFFLIPSITLSAIGADRGAANRLGKAYCPVATVWGRAERLFRTEPDKRHDNTEWIGIEGTMKAVRLNPKTGQLDTDPDNPLPSRFQSPFLFLPKSFHKVMEKELSLLQAGIAFSFALDIAVRSSPGIDGRWIARIQTMGARANDLAAEEAAFGINFGGGSPRQLGAPSVTGAGILIDNTLR